MSSSVNVKFCKCNCKRAYVYFVKIVNGEGNRGVHYIRPAF